VSKIASSPGARPAATVVVMRDGPVAPEIFMVRRHEATAFMAGAYVFPGGRVDDGDRESARVLEPPGRFDDLDSAESAAFFVAAARELFEEAGVLLARDRRGSLVSLADASAHERFMNYRAKVHGGTAVLTAILERERLSLALDALVPFAHWVTPAIDTRRFDTRFFVARVPPGQMPAHDEKETIASGWMTARDALDRCRRDEIILPPPTWTTLRELEPFTSVEAAMTWARNRTIERREPKFLDDRGTKMLLLAGDPLNPERSVEPTPKETRFILTNGRWRAEAAPT
jgi:8-oxo-dGTP pyrophosphatase MutT (NUDIX family)